jgi:glyoxylase-like metal-dependent hydrolase (beta-lactamase superfamily II)
MKFFFQLLKDQTMPEVKHLQFPSPSTILRTSLAGAALLALVSCASMPGESADAALKRADAAMGGATVKNISFAGSGSGTTFGQAFIPGQAWPKITYSSFSRVADYENASFREDAARSRAEPTGGGAVPLMGTGEQRTSGFMRGSSAWNMVGPAPVAAPVAYDLRVHDLWTTPHGIIKAAMANNAVATERAIDGKSMTAVSFTAPGRYRATALINAAGLVEQIDSVMPHPVMGDTASTIVFSDYKDTGGVKFPMRIRQSMGGFPVLDLAVNDVKVNAAAAVEVPALITAFAEKPVATKAAEGVWFLAGGSHNSVAIEMKDHIMVVESPLYDGRAVPTLQEANKMAGNKPIRFVVNSHHHFDHAGGLRSAVAEGATLVTSELARPFYETTFANPNSIKPDAMQTSGKKATVTGVNGKRTFTDGERVVDVYYIEDSVHAQGFLMVHLPKEKILIEADAYTPGAPNTPPPAVPNALHVNLVQNIERLKLGIDQILPLHGRVVPLSELYTAVGRKL